MAAENAPPLAAGESAPMPTPPPRAPGPAQSRPHHPFPLAGTQCITSSPTASTSPTPSLPGVPGRSTEMGYFPSTVLTSEGLMGDCMGGAHRRDQLDIATVWIPHAHVHERACGHRPGQATRGRDSRSCWTRGSAAAKPPLPLGPAGPGWEAPTSRSPGKPQSPAHHQHLDQDLPALEVMGPGQGALLQAQHLGGHPGGREDEGLAHDGTHGGSQMWLCGEAGTAPGQGGQHARRAGCVTQQAQLLSLRGL